ncbi:unnamed protein product [Prorocentrum cordatum]|uniref:Uncharacterized protein n=1 Tax=Prorocentrum cordatum TaxID=2364126 RepID=A0ABN9S133_9DINO|nr:unnamed protein product [Polarella glacialis]
MIMDGETMDVGSVSDLRWVRDAISVARFVMNSTTHTMLAGESATDFAVQMGFTRAPLTTEASARMFDEWRAKNCQPNYWKAGAVVPDPSAQCGPYRPRGPGEEAPPARGGGTDERLLPRSGPGNHDTIGIPLC